jgi:4-amino-4-deoxy-L-arabinose transferase-like glycosyltransferase
MVLLLAVVKKYMKNKEKVMAVKIQNNDQSYCVNYWLCVVGIIILMCCMEAREIGRPFYGLHSWGQATGTWAARTHVRYGLSYTKGLTTWAVGNPPKKNPERYFDHPQLGGILAWFFGLIFGVHEWTFRLVDVLNSILSMALLMRILRGLMETLPALLAGLLCAIFPLTGYFSFGGWTVLFGLAAMYFYLVIIKALTNGPEPTKFHKIALALILFLGLQIAWTGFFYALAIGVHYVFRCLRRKQFPSIPLLAIMAVSPGISMVITFVIMFIGYGGDPTKIIELYKWRSAKGELIDQMDKFDWGLWFAKLWEFSVTNYTLPILIIAILYITIGQLFVFMEEPDSGTGRRRFPQFCLFFMVPFAQLFILRGCLWRHQTWLLPLTPCVAIAASLGIFMLWDSIKKINFKIALVVVLVVLSICVGYCIAGTNYYYAIRWQPEAKIKMFQMLNSRIPPDKYLLSFDPFIVAQHPSKGAFYRPEVAWYLDREIIQAQKLEEVVNAAKTGKYPFYLMPLSIGDPKADAYLMNLSRQLQQLYKYEYIPGQPGETDKKGEFLKAGMPNYILFNLQIPIK